MEVHPTQMCFSSSPPRRSCCLNNKHVMLCMLLSNLASFLVPCYQHWRRWRQGVQREKERAKQTNIDKRKHFYVWLLSLICCVEAADSLEGPNFVFISAQSPPRPDQMFPFLSLQFIYSWSLSVTRGLNIMFFHLQGEMATEQSGLRFCKVLHTGAPPSLTGEWRCTVLIDQDILLKGPIAVVTVHIPLTWPERS